MSAVYDILEFNPELLKPSTLCKAFDRFKMWMWRQFLYASAQHCPLGHGTIDGTYFESADPRR
ncbi:ISH9-type transposase [Natrinema versiforme JCM 10478]|uniref:ISH9-type transposase n=1 Tax=Natrinema versiforme JCM 10478 TaxID=1227496 RepID=L9XPB6_9EURY|nr:ISH9-type transposase [Natrinema versiforme JCM 10478]